MEHLDVLIIGAGVSGIGAGCHLRMKCPELDYAILEGREKIGGTWDLFRYPGIRSDSDMYTFGYAFRPWTEGKDIADGASILNYVRETAREYGVDAKIRFRHRVQRAEWSTAQSRWILDVERDGGERIQLSCGFLIGCTGYYNYEHGYLPEFEGWSDYRGAIAHPQHWPQDLDYRGKRVLVIGSGATAVTLVPSMAADAAHVTMLQRSPTYVISRPAADPLAAVLRKLLPSMAAYKLTRVKNVLLQMYLYRVSQKQPERVRGFLRMLAKRALGPGIDVDRHFNPSYKPWDQRMCLIPDNDLFRVLREGKASIVTDHIERFTEKGVRLASGQEIEADVIVPATGLEIQFFGGMELWKDGKELSVSDLVGYRGMMFGNVPNFAGVVGYTNASWTLKADLTCGYICRLLAHMRRHGYRTAVPVLREGEVEREPLLSLQSGYVQRAIDRMPKQGSQRPWRVHQNYLQDLLSIRFGRFDDGVMSFA